MAVTEPTPDGAAPSSSGVPGPASHDPGNTNPNWIPCKNSLGLSDIPDDYLNDQQQVEIIACLILHTLPT